MMDSIILENYLIDELIEIRESAREGKDYKLCDKIRDYLDSHLVFIFDGVNGQEIYHLTKSSFKFKEQIEKKNNNKLTNRKYVELLIKRDINAEAYFNDWLNRQLKNIYGK